MDGVILGGGYPELYLEELSANKSFYEISKKSWSKDCHVSPNAVA